MTGLLCCKMEGGEVQRADKQNDGVDDRFRRG